MTDLPSTDLPSTDRATDNLLINCARLTPEDSLLIVYENHELGWYDEALVKVILAAARKIGIDTRTLEVGAPANQRNDELLAAMQLSDCTLFLSRIGDQDRFATPTAGKKIVMCYVRSVAMLVSSFAATSYQAMVGMKLALDHLFGQAQHIEIRCPLGTHCNLRPEAGEISSQNDVTVQRFPMGVITPIEAGRLSGRVALASFLTPTGSRVYEPANLALAETVFAIVESGRIVKFEGAAQVVGQVEQHYQSVARQFDIDANYIHSWHVGIHPGLSYRQSAADNPDRWSNTIFNHPRILHFHTCGEYAPGEICWIVKDPTILLDGEPVWSNGVPRLEQFASTRNCLKKWPELKALYSQEPGAIGI
jgi:hypothetical protein